MKHSLLVVQSHCSKFHGYQQFEETFRQQGQLSNKECLKAWNMLFRATQLTKIDIRVCCLRIDCLVTVHKTVVSNFHYFESVWAFLSYFVF